MFGVGVAGATAGVVIPKATVPGAVIVTAGAVNPRAADVNVMVFTAGVVTLIATVFAADTVTDAAGNDNPVVDSAKLGAVMVDAADSVKAADVNAIVFTAPGAVTDKATDVGAATDTVAAVNAKPVGE